MRTPTRPVATLLAAAAAMGGVIACGDDDTESDDIPPAADVRPESAAVPDDSGVRNVIVRTGQEDALSSFTRAVSQSDLIAPLNTRTSLTVFAPSDEAFRTSRGAALLRPGAEDALRRALEDHIVPRRLTAARLTDGLELETLGGATLRIRRDGDRVTVDGVPVETADIQASNGVVHIVPEVLDPKG